MRLNSHPIRGPEPRLGLSPTPWVPFKLLDLELSQFWAVPVSTNKPAQARPKYHVTGLCVELQTERLWVGFISDQYSNPFLNKGFGSRSGFDSKHVLLVPNPVPIEILKSGSITGST